MTISNFLLPLKAYPYVDSDNMAQIPLTIKLTKAQHAWLKSGPLSMSKFMDQILADATINDVVDAIVTRYASDDVPDDANAITKVIISHQAMNNLDLFALKIGIPRDTVLRLILEKRFSKS